MRLLEDNKSWDVEQTPELARLVGDALYEDGRVPEAVKWLDLSCKQRSRLDARNPDRLRSQFSLAVVLHCNGQPNKAIKLLEQVVAVYEQTLEEHHPDRLQSQFHLADAYRIDGQTKRAITLLEQVVEVQERFLAHDDPRLLAWQDSLAHAYTDNGQTKEALMLLKHIVTIKEKLLEDHQDHPNCVVS